MGWDGRTPRPCPTCYTALLLYGPVTWPVLTCAACAWHNHHVRNEASLPSSIRLPWHCIVAARLNCCCLLLATQNLWHWW